MIYLPKARVSRDPDSLTSKTKYNSVALAGKRLRAKKNGQGVVRAEVKCG
jgi:hypothetical protein